MIYISNSKAFVQYTSLPESFASRLLSYEILAGSEVTWLTLSRVPIETVWSPAPVYGGREEGRGGGGGGREGEREGGREGGMEGGRE